MTTRLLLSACLACVGLTPAIAQQATPDSGYVQGYANAPGRNDDAVNARQAPVTAALNADANAAANTSAGNQAQYDADRTAYLEALARHDAAVDRTDARYARQQRAYADAMSVWRVQVQRCKDGHRKACDLPPPNVSDYY